MPQKFILFVAILCTKFCFSQTPEELLEKTRIGYTPEKIYIHFDKQSYIAGDTIWFKAYLMNGMEPSKISTVLNLELVDLNNKVISQKILPISGSASIGHVLIDSFLAQGAYNVVAFTKHMMNFGTESFYNKKLNIYNTASKKSELQKTDLVPDVKFLPEGGHLIDGLENTVAFKSIDNNANPLDVSGKIVDDSGVEIASIKSIHDGMGKFVFTPQLGKKYKALCLFQNNVKSEVYLPQVVSNKTQLKINVLSEKIVIEVNNQKASSDIEKAKIVIGVLENTVVFKRALSNEKLNDKIDVPISQIPSGVLKVTCFNESQQPLSERMIFVNNGDYQINAKPNFTNSSFSPRGKNSFAFTLDNNIQGSYSISITDDDIALEADNGNDHIVSRLLLTDNLRGKINNPAYYFEANDETHQLHLDLVMLTHGWKRYNWNTILQNQFPTMAFKDPNFISIKGIAKKPYSNEVLKNTSIRVLAKTKNDYPDMFSLKTDETGSFEIPSLVFEDTVAFTFQNASNPKDNRVYLNLSANNLKEEFKVTKQFISKYEFTSPTLATLSKINRLNADVAKWKKNARDLEEVVLKTKVKSQREVFEKKYVNGLLGNDANKVLDLMETPPNGNGRIFDYLQGRLTSVKISGGPSNYTLNYRNLRSMIGGDIPMAVFLDDVQVDPNAISFMLVQDIALVKLYSSGPLSGPGGALALYTYRDRKLSSSALSNFSTAEIAGFSPVPEFYSPDYSKNAINAGIKEDVRSTLYWNPYILLENGKKEINVSFYNSDNAKRFKIVLEGVNQNGGILHFEKILE
jgi:hypothetical protein